MLEPGAPDLGLVDGPAHPGPIWSPGLGGEVVVIRQPSGATIPHPFFGDLQSTFSTSGGPNGATYRPTAAYYPFEWQLGAMVGLERIWAEYKGAGVHVGVFDTGIDTLHEAIAPNYDASLEVVPAQSQKGTHGTMVAGVIAGADTGKAVGVAFQASITGVPMISLPMLNWGASFMGRFDVVNCSWGPTNPFGFGQGVFDSVLSDAVANGRGGLGTIVVDAAGNEGASDNRDVNFNSFAQSRYSITVGATTYNGDVTDFSTRGASILVSAPGYRDVAPGRDTDASLGGSNYYYFSGTSAAAPVVSGVVALMLSANRGLGWRDVQEILALTADHTTPTALNGPVVGNMKYGWTINGARNVNGGGLHYSNDVGFGQVDAFEAVRLAEVWSLFGAPKTSANEASATVAAGVITPVKQPSWSYSFKITASLRVEHVDLGLGAILRNRLSNVEVILTSASGTQSILSGPNQVSQLDPTVPQPRSWTYGSEAFRGELAAGTWTVTLKSLDGTDLDGTILNPVLDLFGSAPSSDDVYHYTNEFWKMLSLDPGRALLSDTNGGVDWIDAAALTGNLRLDMNAGAQSTLDGHSFITIDANTLIENAVTGDGNDTILGNAADNAILGMRGNDLIHGGDGNDDIDGGQDNDTLYGDAGNDILNGGGGHDDLYGGSGADVFRFTSSFGKDSTAIIEDFQEGQDVIDLSGLHLAFSPWMIQTPLAAFNDPSVGLVLDLGGDYGKVWVKAVSSLNVNDFRFA